MRAAIIEDQTLVRDYLSAVLARHFGASSILTIGSMAELGARDAELAEVDLILMDVDRGDGTTLDWALERSRRGVRGVMVALSSIGGAFPFKLLHAAGISLVHKKDGEAELLAAIRQALTGSAVVSRGALSLIQSAGRDPLSPHKLLSDRELQVLALLGQRLRNEEIAELVGCSLATATDHRKRLMRKLKIHTVEELIDYAIRHGIVYDSKAASAHHRRQP